MAERTDYDQPDNKYISNHPTYGEGTLPSYQAIEAQKQKGYDQPKVPYQSTFFVVSHQPRPVGIVTIQTPPPDYTVPSILACLCCFWPTGLCAINYANEAKNLAAVGDYVGARRVSNNARKLLIISFAIGLIWISIVAVIQLAKLVLSHF